MLDISVRFLGGEFVAQTPAGGAEWPPHPARLLYALLAAWYAGERAPDELDALRWLESEPAPAILCASEVHAETYEAWVPMNSVPNWNKKGDVRPSVPKVPKLRSGCHVGDDPVTFVWDADAPVEHERALGALCTRCTRLGSAESLVSMWPGRRMDLYGPAWRPSGSGTMLRVGMRGVVDAIVASETMLPGRILPCSWSAYRWGTSRRPGRMITVGLVRGGWPIEWAPALAHQMRRALLAVAEAAGLPLLPLLHGHAEDGSPLERPHLQFCPLPHVGRQHATGAVLGLAFVVPHGSGDEDRAYVESVVAAWFARGGSLALDGGRVLEFGPADARVTLSESRWCRPSRVWQTVLPMELPRHVLKGRGWNRRAWERVRDGVQLACSQAAFPPADEVEVSHSPFAIASPHTRAVRGPRRRPLVHVRLLFPHAVEGPVVLGAGKHIGLGLMEPVGA